MKSPMFVRSLLALVVTGLLVCSFRGHPRLMDEIESPGLVTTLYAHDPLLCSLDLLNGRPGLFLRQGEVLNTGSHLCLGYLPDSLTVSAQGGDSGAVLDLGTLTELAQATGTHVTGNGGNAYASLPPDWARARILGVAPASQAHAPIRAGHVYLARIVSDGQTAVLAKLLVLEFRPGESVTFRWQQLEA